MQKMYVLVICYFFWTHLCFLVLANKLQIPDYSRHWMKAPVISMGLITKPSLYILQNLDSFLFALWYK